MDLTRWPHADDILDRALDRPPAERVEFVRRAANGDRELASALEAVLAEASSADGFLVPGAALTGAVAGDLVSSAEAAEAPSRLSPGQPFGNYQIVATLGRGGMGEVYRARDSRLGRDVALKVLPAHFSASAEKRARFEREARVLASLNDPHVGAIYEIEEHDGIVALVLELVEGETLAERLSRGRLGLNQALDIAEEIVYALMAAHRRGIVHRDLKPANVKVTPDGRVKVLDFGIATFVDAGDDRPPVSPETAELRGLVLGTASYVSPERARGLPTDHRADIWAFGCVLFEMLTGVKAFDGGSPTEILARVIERDPEVSRLPVATPASILRLLDRTLRKDTERRLGFVGDALLDIDDAREEMRGGDSIPVPRSFKRRAALVAWLTLAGGLVAGAAGFWVLQGQPEPPVATHLAVPVPPEDDLIAGELPGLALSPDGQTVVYRARREGVIKLIRRRLSDDEPAVIEGSDNGASPFFSPDGHWIGFATDQALMKVPIDGGRPTKIADAPGGARATWATDDTIWLSLGTSRVLHRVSAAGGLPEPATTLDTDAGDQTHEGPSALAGGRVVLFTIGRGSETHVAAFDPARQRVSVLAQGRQAMALRNDWLAFARGDALFVARLDLKSMTLASEPTLAQADLELAALSRTAQFAVSLNGSLLYMPGRAAVDGRSPVWVDRQGVETPIAIESKAYTRASVSPDGRRLALAIASPEDRDVWVHDLTRGSLMRLTLDPGTDTAPVWSPDGRKIAFRSERDGGGVFIMASDGSGTPTRLTRSDGPGRPAHTPYSFTPDGTRLLFAELRSYSDQGIGEVTVGPKPEARVLLDGPFAEGRPALSPDGKWLAYQSDESGRYEIYVRPYPDVGTARVQVSTVGGTSAKWTPDRHTLVFFDGSSMAQVTLRPGPPVSFSAPVPLFEASKFNERLGPVYDIAPDGRFLFLRQAGPNGEPVRRSTLLLVSHWATKATGQ